MFVCFAFQFIGRRYLEIRSKPFRPLAVAGLGVIVIGTIVFGFWIYESTAKADQKRALAKTYINTGEIAVIDPSVTFDTFDGHPTRIVGRVRNNSSYTLEKFALRLTFHDCGPSSPLGTVPEQTFAQCEPVGEEDKEIRVIVPPNQSRDFDDYLSGPILSPKGKIQSGYQVVSTSTQTY